MFPTLLFLCLAITTHPRGDAIDGKGIFGTTAHDGTWVAIQKDGSAGTVDSAALQTISSDSWPGWRAIVLARPESFFRDPSTRSMMALDDGQRVAGGFELVNRSLQWRSRELGMVAVNLERLSWIGPTAIAAEASPERDRVLLINGDRVDGFVNSLQAERGVEVEVPNTTGDPKKTSMWFDLARVASIRLAARTTPPTGWRFWLVDGTVVDADHWKKLESNLAIQGCHLEGVDPSTVISWDQVLAVQPLNTPVVAMSSIVWSTADETPQQRLTPARVRLSRSLGPLNMRDVDLLGPGTFTATIPEGTWLLNLQLESTPTLAHYTDCTIRVLDGEKEIMTEHWTSLTPPRHLQIPLHGRTLTVVISNSAQGAFGAAIQLKDGLLISMTEAAIPATPPHPTAPTSPQAGSSLE